MDAIINRDDSELRAAVDNLLRKCATVSMFDSRLLLRPLLSLLLVVFVDEEL